MLKKVACGVGMLGSLLAAEGLNRFGSMVAAMKGGDAPFYKAFLYVSIASAGVLLISFFKEIPKGVKYLVVLSLLVSTGLMLKAPNFPVNRQIFTGLLVAALASLAIPIPKNTKMDMATSASEKNEK